MTELTYREKHRTLKDQTGEHVVTGMLINPDTHEVTTRTVTIDRFDDAEAAIRNLIMPNTEASATEATMSAPANVPRNIDRKNKVEPEKESDDVGNKAMIRKGINKDHGPDDEAVGADGDTTTEATVLK